MEKYGDNHRGMEGSFNDHELGIYSETMIPLGLTLSTHVQLRNVSWMLYIRELLTFNKYCTYYYLVHKREVDSLRNKG